VELVRLELDGAIARLTLDHPERRNALTEATLGELEECVAGLRRRPEIQVTVVAATGPCFSAGADLAERSRHRSRAERRLGSERWQQLFDDLERLPHPTVAACRGAAIGAGLLLALACDLRVVADDFTARLPEVAMGVPVAGAGIPRVAREVGLPRARDLVLTGRTLSAAEAQEWGLVTRVVPSADLESSVDEIVAGMLQGGPDGLRVATRSLRSMGRLTSAVDAGWADAELASYRGSVDPPA
jgi:enoyl-CoA hydratase/carnithine racemase